MIAWTTSARMHSVVERRCVLGCDDEVDTLGHHLMCPVASAALANYAIFFRAAERTPRALLGLSLCGDAQRADAVYGVLVLSTPHNASPAPTAGWTQRARARSFGRRLE